MGTFSRTITQKTILFVVPLQQNKLSLYTCAINGNFTNRIRRKNHFKKVFLQSVLVASSIELSDPRHNRDDTEKRYSFIQKSLNEVSLGKLLWCDFLFAFIRVHMSTLYCRLKAVFPNQRVKPFAPVPHAQEWAWCNDFVNSCPVRTENTFGE